MPQPSGWRKSSSTSPTRRPRSSPSSAGCTAASACTTRPSTCSNERSPADGRRSGRSTPAWRRRSTISAGWRPRRATTKPRPRASSRRLSIRRSNLRPGAHECRRHAGRARPHLPGSRAQRAGRAAAPRGAGDQAEALGDDHGETAVSLSDLASVLRLNGDLDGAEALLRQSLEVHRQTRGEAHAMTATTLHDVALITAAKGDWAPPNRCFARRWTFTERRWAKAIRSWR